MNAIEINSQALDALENGDFFTAQRLFRENCRSKDYRAINNMGVFYIENGLTRSDGKIVSAIAYGKKYIKKAYEKNRSETVLLNMGMIAAQFDKDYKSAVEFYKEAYSINESDDAFYNICACLYRSAMYQSVIGLMERCDLSKADNCLLYSFSLLALDPLKFTAQFKASEIKKTDIDDDFKILLLYFADKKEILLNDIYDFLNDWSPDDYMWAVIIEILEENHVQHETIINIIEQAAEGYSDESNIIKNAVRHLKSPLDREKYIRSGVAHYFVPVFKKRCGYFGCPIHHTDW